MDEILVAMEDNCASHASHLHRFLHGGIVSGLNDVVVADSGLADDTFNLIARARFSTNDVQTRVNEVIDLVVASGRPFSWWVAPTSTPSQLGEVLSACGLRPSETETAMFAVLGDIRPFRDIDGLSIVPVRTVEQLRDYAMLMARNWNPPAPAVDEFFEGVASGILNSKCRSRFAVAYLGESAVAGAEIHLHAGVAGLYGVVTLEEYRRRGFGTAVTSFALQSVRESGVKYAVLQASSDGSSVYRRMGFESIGVYTEYAVQASA